ncbi:MAG TPA: methyltransferase domain-containing protein [Solirubrobacteraceae bacterium]|jgi:ubiquinone/menaquinone biosynthesis C-methylase UbiE
MVDPDAVKAEQRAFYAGGDYSWLSRWFMPAAEDLVAAAGVGPGDRVLDVAAGDGNVAVAAARRGARVTAVDLTPEQVEAGRARTEAEGLAVTWVTGDAEALPVLDASFEHVLSAFGVMYAPRPEVAAAELFRAVAPGGTVGVVAWPPGGFNARLYEAAAPFLSADEEGREDGDAAPSPEDWGDALTVRRLLAADGAGVEVVTGVVSRQAASAAAFWREAAANVPVLQAMRGMLSDADFAAFGEAYQRITAECARRDGDGIRLDITYTRALARR